MVDDPPEKRRRGHDGVAAAETSGRPLPALPDELWCKILTDVHQNDVFAFASSCRQLRRAQVSCGRTLKTKMKQYLHSQERVGRFSVLWFEWHSRCTRVKTKEDMKARTMLINASAFLGHLEVRQNERNHHYCRRSSKDPNSDIHGLLSSKVLRHWRGRSVARMGVWDTWTCANAAKGGKLEVLKWLRREVKCPWDSSTCEEAAGAGHLDLLKWAKAEGCEWATTRLCHKAARWGRLDVLKWARREGCPWTSRKVCSYAAEGGHLETLEWLVDTLEAEHGPSASALEPYLNERTAYCAAKGGELETLMWLRRRGCPWSEDTCEYAAMAGHLEVLRWCRVQDPPCPWDAYACAFCAEKNGHLDTFRWIQGSLRDREDSGEAEGSEGGTSSSLDADEDEEEAMAELEIIGYYHRGEWDDGD